MNETGARVVEYHNPAAYDELVLQVTSLWRSMTVRVRIATRPVTERDVATMAARVTEAGDAGGVLIAPLGVESPVAPASRVTLIDENELVARLERSPAIGWSDRKPRPAYDRMDVMRGLERQSVLLDPTGFTWLPILALNEVPPELAAVKVAPQDLFERVAFRIFTGVLRFGGQRHGEAARGQRLPDSVLTLPGSAATATLLDCKAAADGYTMEADHVLRFQRYIRDARPRMEERGYDLRFLIVLSSSFPGSPKRHPLIGRARELRESDGVELVYMRAVDLARVGVSVEARQLDPDDREALEWVSAFSPGLVTWDSLEQMLAG